MHMRQRALSVAIRVAAAVSLLGFAATAHPGAVFAAVNCDKSAPTSGVVQWTVGATWSGTVPLATDRVCLPTGSETVAVDATSVAVAATVTIGTGAKLLIKGRGDVTILTVGTGITNAGTIQIGEASHTFLARLDLTSGVLTNKGAIVTAGLNNTLNASIDNQGTITTPPGGPLFIGKMGGVITNSGTWTVNADTTVSVFTSFTMTGGAITGSADMTLNRGEFDHQGGNLLSNNLRLFKTELKANPSSGAGRILVTGTGNLLASDIGANEIVTVAGGYHGDGILESPIGRTNNGTIILRTDGAADTSKIAFASGATLENNGTLTTNNETAQGGPARVIEGNLVNNGTINVNYDTKFDQAAAVFIQNFGGTTTVASGKTLDLTGSDGTLELSGGTLNGTGTVKGDVQNDDGIVAPGKSPGILTVDGNFTQAAGGTLAIEIGGTTPGTGADRLVVTGIATMGGTLALTTINSFVPSLSFNYVYLTTNQLQGTTFAVTGTDAGGGKSYVPSYSFTEATLTVVGGGISRKPDAQIALGSGTFIGNDIYNTDASGQSKSKTAGKGVTVTFTVKIQNDGFGAKDKFKVLATGANITGFTFACKQGATDITAAVNNGTYTTANVQVGQSATITCTLKIGSAAAHLALEDKLLTISSFNDPGQKDAVQMVAQRS